MHSNYVLKDKIKQNCYVTQHQDWWDYDSFLKEIFQIRTESNRFDWDWCYRTDLHLCKTRQCGSKNREWPITRAWQIALALRTSSSTQPTCWNRCNAKTPTIPMAPYPTNRWSSLTSRTFLPGSWPPKQVKSLTIELVQLKSWDRIIFLNYFTAS